MRYLFGDYVLATAPYISFSAIGLAQILSPASLSLHSCFDFCPAL